MPEGIYSKHSKNVYLTEQINEAVSTEFEIDNSNQVEVQWLCFMKNHKKILYTYSSLFISYLSVLERFRVPQPPNKQL